MFDNAFELVTDHPVVFLLLGAFVAYCVVDRIKTERRIQRLGGHAPQYQSWVPFGIGFVIDGVSHMFSDDNLHFWHQHFMSFGATQHPDHPYTFETRVAGERLVVTADPENIKAVLATQFQDFGKGTEFRKDFKDFLGDGIFAADGQTWHDSRQLIRPQFIKDRVSDLNCFERHSSILISMLGGQGQVVDLRDLFFRFTLDAATDFILGKSANSLHNPQSQFAYSFGRIQHIQSLISRVGHFKALLPKKELKDNVAVINDFVQPYIEEALALSPDELEKRTKTDEGYTFLHAIASYTRDRKVLRDQLISVLLAGRDTTACTLSWLFWELSHNSSIVADLRQEIADHVGFDRPPSYDDLKSMKLLQSSMNEILRLYPVVPFNVRVALKDTSIPRGGGANGDEPVAMPKDTPFAYSTHYMHLTSDIYPPTSDKFPPPELFAPRRWEHWTPKPWTYLPFNGGPRICVGQNFALMEMGYTVVRMLQRFSRIEPRMEDVWSGSDKKAYSERKSNKRPWQRRRQEEPELVEKALKIRDSMVSEIVLQPRREVRVAFYE